MKIIFLIILFFFSFHSDLKANYNLITFFDLNSGYDYEEENISELKFEYLEDNKKFIKIFNKERDLLDNRSHFIKEKINFQFSYKPECEVIDIKDNKSINVYALDNSDNLNNFIKDYFATVGEVDKIIDISEYVKLDLKTEKIIKVKKNYDKYKEFFKNYTIRKNPKNYYTSEIGSNETILVTLRIFLPKSEENDVGINFNLSKKYKPFFKKYNLRKKNLGIVENIKSTRILFDDFANIKDISAIYLFFEFPPEYKDEIENDFKVENFLEDFYRIKTINYFDSNIYLNSLLSIKNNEPYYALDFAIKNYYRNFDPGFLIIDTKECISELSPILYETKYKSYFEDADANFIKNEIQKYYKNNQILKLNNRSFDFDEIIVKGNTFNSKISDSNFFLTKLSKEQFMILKKEGIRSLDFTWSPLLHYDKSLILNEKFEEVKIDNLQDIRDVPTEVHVNFFILFFIILLMIFIYYNKKFPIQFKYFNHLKLLFLIIIIFSIVYQSVLPSSVNIYVAAYSLILFSLYIIIFRELKK